MSAQPTTRFVNRLRLGLLTIFFVLAILILALLSAAAGATQTHLFEGKFGTAAQPEFETVGGLAVDQSSGDLIVIDSKAQTISRFHPDGTPHSFAALNSNVIDAKGTGDCGSIPADCDQTPQNGFTFDSNNFAGTQQVAVDNSGTATDGNIYVTQGLQAGGNLVDVFAADGSYLGQLTAAGATPFGSIAFPFSPCGVAVDSGGNVYLGGGYDKRIYKFAPSANPPVNADLSATFPTSEVVCNLAVGAGATKGALFATTFYTLGEEEGVLKYGLPGGGFQGFVAQGKYRLVSVDPATGHLFAASDAFGNSGPAVREFDSNSSVISTISGISASVGMAAGNEHLYLASPRLGGESIPIRVYGPLVTVPDVTTGDFEITGDASAVLEGTVDPDGVPLEECAFEYGPTNAYGQTVACEETVGEIGTSPKSVHAEVSGLTPETRIHYRLVAKNVNDTVEGVDRTFRTPGKPNIVGVWSDHVGLAEATLKAQINPENSPTTYRFEWGLDSSYGNSTEDISIGAGEADLFVSLPQLHGLQSGTTYHYRVIAENGIGISETADHTFTTYPVAAASSTDCPNQVFRTGASAALPDCRAFEMVSPVDKNGGDIKVLVSIRGFPARLEQSSTNGDRFAFSSVTAFAGALAAPWTSEYVASREDGVGWSTIALNPPRGSVSFITDPSRFDVPYETFSSDLSTGWVRSDTGPVLDECGVPGFSNIYRRDIFSGGYRAITIVPPSNHPSGSYFPSLHAVSTDGTHAVFSAKGKLTEEASSALNGPEGINQLYEHVQDEGCGQLRVVSVLPNGNASAAPSAPGAGGGYLGEDRETSASRAVSLDGTRVFWTTYGSTPTLYVRINADQEQSVVSGGKCNEADKGCTLPVAPGGRFWTAAADGSRAYYTVGAHQDLYEFDVDKAIAGEPATTLIAGEVRGTVGSSTDASRLYFVSKEDLNGEGVTGQPNLYLREDGGSTSLVATLANADLNGFQMSGFSLAYPDPIRNGVRVTPDGEHLVFVSLKSLTGYDNIDATDGRPNLEIYLYDADTEDLACVSCNPSGGRPHGREFGPENDVIRRVSAQMPPGEDESFTPRVLSTDGDTLFFESFEALLPRDVNGKSDVYQWQRASSQGECEEGGAELFVPSSGGCLTLISSGRSSIDSEIADVSPDGSNVFIRTGQSLLPQDPGQIDVYDARVNGGFPLPPAKPASCEGEACQGPLALPDDPAPASSYFEGPGNVDEGRPRPCLKGKVRRKGHCVPKPCPKGKVRQKRRCVAKEKSPHSKQANRDRRQGR